MSSTHSPAIAPQDSTYDTACFDRLAAVEDRHFWFRARTRAISALVRSLVAEMPDSYRVLEVGCGTGTVLRELHQVCARGSVIGLDFFHEGVAWARRRSSVALVQADAFLPPFSRRFQMVCVFDVIEHLDDDTAVLRTLRDLLAPGGLLLVTVPAHPRLWSYFDEYSRHRRRYSLDGLVAKLADAGYEVQYATPYMSALLPMIWCGRKVSALLRRPAGQASSELAELDLRIIPFVNRLLFWSLLWEAPCIARHRILPFGASLIAVASTR
jgi:SAM-dependent methyltransferase